MFSRILVSFLLFLAGVVAPPISAFCAESDRGGSLDLTPLAGEYTIEGLKRPLVTFKTVGAIEGTVSYVPPWKITGGFENATLEIPESGALARIWKADNRQDLDFSDENAVRAWANRNQPAGANNLSIQSVEQNPVQISGKPSVEITFTYGLFGRSIKGSMILTRRSPGNPELLVFELGCYPANFEKLHRLLQKSLYSIQGF